MASSSPKHLLVTETGGEEGPTTERSVVNDGGIASREDEAAFGCGHDAVKAGGGGEGECDPSDAILAVAKDDSSINGSGGDGACATPVSKDKASKDNRAKGATANNSVTTTTPVSKTAVGPKARTVKGARPIPSSLLRNTAATAAKVRTTSFTNQTANAAKPPRGNKGTPKLTAPFSTASRKTPVNNVVGSVMRKPLISSAPRNSGGGGRQVSSAVASSAIKIKKVAVSSFIADEPDKTGSGSGSNLPDHHEWDASAIAPRVLQVSSSSSTGDCTITSNKDNCSVLVSSSSELKSGSISSRTLLKSRLPVGIKKGAALSNKILPSSGPLKVVHPTNMLPASSNDSKSHPEVAADFSAEDLKLADDYLISELIKMNAKEALELAREDAEAQVGAIWLALEKLRSQVIKRQDENRLLKQMLEFLNGYGEIKEELENVTDEFPKSHLESLAEALVRCQDHLKVGGVKLDKEKNHETQLCQVLKESTRLGPVVGVKTDSLEMAEMASSVSEAMLDTIKSFERCQMAIQDVNNKKYHVASLSGGGGSAAAATVEEDPEEDLVALVCSNLAMEQSL